MQTVNDIRQKFIKLKEDMNIAQNNTLELLYQTFEVNDQVIFGTLDLDYAKAELDWYLSQSLNVNDIPGKVPAIWQAVSSINDEINSNYGYLAFSDDNGRQFDNVIHTLKRDKYSRQAVMVYTRPSIHRDATRDGMLDFICTNNTQFLIRDNSLDLLVNMRSNDAVYGFKNDVYWQSYIMQIAYETLRNTYPDLQFGKLIWHVGSLHVYPKHFNLVK